MCVYSKFWENWERKNLAPYAVRSDNSWYNERNSNDSMIDVYDPSGSRSRYRTQFEIDKDRITNSQSFRRLEYKTQVFVTHEGDNYRSRLTHTLEVTEIARHIARSLRLNEHLVEAIALGHDLGHAPYGHIAEKAINDWVKNNATHHNDIFYFSHNRQSVENVEHLEPGYDWDNRNENDSFGEGLNLTRGVKEGILVHTSNGYRGLVHKRFTFEKDYENAIRNLSKSNHEKGFYPPGTLEAQVVRIADDIAQRIHDLEDGLRSKIITKKDIHIVVKGYINKLKKDLFSIDSFNIGKYFTYKNSNVRISKEFIYDIVNMLDKGNEYKDEIGSKNYMLQNDEIILGINNRLKRDIKFKNNMLLVGIVAFLLHMWKDDPLISHPYLSNEEQVVLRARILKYSKILKNIASDNGYKKVPIYHVIATLRGVMFANVIEHTFWKIHTNLDPNYHKPSNIKKLKKMINNNAVCKKSHLVFVIKDGLILEDGDKIRYEDVEGGNKLYHFEFSNSNAMNKFKSKYLHKILKTNGSYFQNDGTSKKYKILDKIYWLNKSEKPILTEYALISGPKYDERLIPLQNIEIYFTGYKELCPGPKDPTETCTLNQKIKNNICKTKKCIFFKDIKYPDIKRIVNFQRYVMELDIKLGKMITEKLINNPRIARMNYMGEKIIRFLIEQYLKKPRIMHSRALTQLRVYRERKNISKRLKEWVDIPPYKKHKQNIPEEILKEFAKKGKDQNDTWECDHYSLLRRVIDHIAGMTDRFIANEYNRLTQSGREIEYHDEEYFIN